MAKAKKTPLVPEVQEDWTTGMSTGPVFIDGLTNPLHYLIVATFNSADKYRAVAIGRFGADYFKVKFYGSFEEWGFNESSLEDKFKAGEFLSRADEKAGYERYMTGKEGVRRIVKALGQTRNVTVANLDAIWKAFDIPFEERMEISKIAHPQRGGFRPLLPFKQVLLLDHMQSVAA
jgi:hypothetical protein